MMQLVVCSGSCIQSGQVARLLAKLDTLCVVLCVAPCKHQVVRVHQSDCLKRLRTAVEKGTSIILQLTTTSIDPALASLVSRTLHRRDGCVTLKVGDKEVEYNTNFRCVDSTACAALSLFNITAHMYQPFLLVRMLCICDCFHHVGDSGCTECLQTESRDVYLERMDCGHIFLNCPLQESCI